MVDSGDAGEGSVVQDGNSRTPHGPTDDDELIEFHEDSPRTPATTGGRGSEPGSVHVIVHPDRTQVVLVGEVDADLAADLQEATSDAEGTGLPIEIDAGQVTFMDSSGIAFLARIATRSAHPVRIRNAPETVRFLLEVTRIGELLEVVEDADGDDEAPVDHGLPTIGLADRRRGPEPDGVA